MRKKTEFTKTTEDLIDDWVLLNDSNRCGHSYTQCPDCGVRWWRDQPYKGAFGEVGKHDDDCELADKLTEVKQLITDMDKDNEQDKLST